MTDSLSEDWPNFEASRPASDWNLQLGADCPGVFKAVAKGVFAYLSGNAAGAVNAAIDGVGAFRIEDQPRPAVLAWHLIRRALARAMAELTVEALRSLDQDPDDPGGMVARLDAALDAAPIRIARDFFARPAELPVVEAVRAPLGEWLAGFGLNEARVGSVGRRLPAYFTFALHREWGEHPEYAPIQAELDKADTPFARADARERAWLKNAAYLRRLVQEPVFEETFGLEQVYVPLRAWYRERLINMETGEEQERKIIVDLEEHLTSWFKAADPKDPVRMISGGPGSGKTSFVKMWSATLAQMGHRVLFIPLYRLTFHDDLERALAGFLADWNVLTDDPFDAKVGERRLLILFDGLDELAMQGRAGQQVGLNFVEMVCERVGRMNDQGGRCVKAVLGGRDIVVQSSEHLIEEWQALHLLPYHGPDEEAFVDPHGLLKSDQYSCNRWWRQLGEAIGEGYGSVPRTLRQGELAETTAQPLLNYLIALSYRQGRRDFLNLNLVYKDLLQRVYERRWTPKKHATAKNLTLEQYDLLLDELGLAAWQSTSAARTISEEEIELACARVGLMAKLDISRKARGQERSVYSPPSTFARLERQVVCALSSLRIEALVSI